MGNESSRNPAAAQPAARPAHVTAEIARLEKLSGTSPGEAVAGLEALLPTLNDQHDQLTLLNRVTPAYLLIGRVPDGIAAAERAIELARALKDKEGEARAVIVKLRGLSAAGRWAEAQPIAEHNLEFIRSDPALKAQLAPCLAVLGMIYRRIGNIEDAVNALEEGLKVAGQLGDRRTEAACRNLFGLIMWGQDRYSEAREQFQRAELLFRELEDAAGVSSITINLAVVLSAEGKPRESIEYHLRSLAHKRKIGERTHESLILANLAYNHLMLEEYEPALAYAQESIDLQHALGVEIHLAIAYNMRGAANLRQGRYQVAEPDLLEALERAKKTVDSENISRAHLYLAELTKKRLTSPGPWSTSKPEPNAPAKPQPRRCETTSPTGRSGSRRSGANASWKR